MRAHTPKDKAAIISEASALLYRDDGKLGTEEEKVHALTMYIAAKYLISFRTAKEYATVVVARQKMELPDMKLSNLEIMAREEQKGVFEGRGGEQWQKSVEALRERLAREEEQLRAGWGDVAEVSDSEEGE